MNLTQNYARRCRRNLILSERETDFKMKLLVLCTAALYCSVAAAVPVAVPAPFPGGKYTSF